jgi:hypothetical protein
MLIVVSLSVCFIRLEQPQSQGVTVEKAGRLDGYLLNSICTEPCPQWLPSL